MSSTIVGPLRWAALAIAVSLSMLLSAPLAPAGAAPLQQGMEDGEPELIEDSEPPPLAPASTRIPPAELVQGVIRLSNAERAKQGAPPLQTNPNLMKAAQDYAAVLAPGPCFEHTCPPVPELRNRVVSAGYTNMQRIGENIAAGDETAESVVASWMDSPGHKANILNPEFKEIGVGFVRGTGDFGTYWVQVFGTRFQG